MVKSKDNRESSTREVTVQDARAYADMMNRSDKAWPWSRGIKYTAKMAKENIEGSAALGHFVAEADGRIIGTSSLYKGFFDKDSGYVGYLAVEPEYHGKKYGKALLRRCVDRAIEEGIERVDLHTWAGNLKALPLYKKMGFFWVPETHVEMKNFIPTILNHTMFEDFFAKNPDWYATQVRDLSPKEDLVERDGIRIYEYSFRAGRDQITAVADKEGLWLTGGSNNDMEVWVHPENEICPEGFPQKMFWEITNRLDSEIEVTLIVGAPETIEILERPPTSATIPPGESVKLEGIFRIDPGSDRKESWEQPDRVITDIAVGGRMFRFQTGVGRKGALELSYDPRFLMIPPGGRTRLHVRLKNRTKLPLRGRVLIVPPTDCLKVQRRTHAFELDPEGYSGFATEVRLSEEAPTCYLPIAFQPVYIAADGKEIKAKEEVLQGSCVRPGEMLDFVEQGKVLQLNNDRVRLSIDLRRGGRSLIRDRLSEEMIAGGFGGDALGPPFWPSEFDMCRCEHSVEHGDGFIRATISMKSELHEGLTLFKIFTLRSSWPTVSVQYGLTNAFPKPRSFKLRFGANSLLNKNRVYIPMKEGLVSEEISLTGFPGWRDIPTKPRDFPENWKAVEGYKDRLLTVGSIWPREVDEIDLGGGSLGQIKTSVRVRANGRTLVPPLHLCLGEGTWASVRELWRKLEVGEVARERRHLEVKARRAIEFGFPDPLLVSGPTPHGCELKISSVKKRAEKAWLEIHPPSGWSANPDHLTFRKLGAREIKKGVTLSPPLECKPGVYEGQLTLRTEEHRWHRTFPVLNLGTGRVRVEVIEDRGLMAYLVSNGVLEFKVSPAFGGTVYELRSGDVEYLASSFPTAKPMLWYNPWYGGLHGYIERDASKAWQETFEAAPIRRGLWKGVETVCQPGSHVKEMKGMVVRTRYLLARSSRIIRVEQILLNPTKARIEKHTGLSFFVGMGEERDFDSVVPDEEDLPYVRPRTDKSKSFSSHNGWVALRNPKIDAGMVLAGPVSERAFIWAEEARGLTLLEGSLRQELGPGESSTWAWHLAFCSSDVDEIHRYRHMRTLSPQGEPLYVD